MTAAKATAMATARDPHSPKSRHFDESKFRELVLYVSRRCEDDKTFGEIKLNKILYFSEFRCFGETGKPITGQPFARLPKGPCSQALLPVRKKMMKARDCVTRDQEYHGYKQIRTIALREADLTKFSAKEIAIVESVISEFSDHTATAISHRSHQDYSWLAADDREEIPYETVFFSRRALTPNEIKYGQTLLATKA